MITAGARQLGIAAILARRDLATKLGAIGPYALASAICAVTALLASAFRRGFATETVAVSADPLASVHALVLILLAIILGTRVAASLSWEREHRTLDVLLSGPVTPAAIVAAKLAAEIATLLLLGLVYSAYLLAAPMGDARSALDGIAGFWSLAVLALPLIGLGLLVGAIAPTVRAAVVAFLSIVLVLSSLEGAAAWLGAQGLDALSLAAVYLRGVLSMASDWLSPVSPVAYLADIAHSAAGSASEPRPIGALALLLVLTGASMLVLALRGARP